MIQIYEQCFTVCLVLCDCPSWASPMNPYWLSVAASGKCVNHLSACGTPWLDYGVGSCSLLGGRCAGACQRHASCRSRWCRSRNPCACCSPRSWFDLARGAIQPYVFARFRTASYAMRNPILSLRVCASRLGDHSGKFSMLEHSSADSSYYCCGNAVKPSSYFSQLLCNVCSVVLDPDSA